MPIFYFFLESVTAKYIFELVPLGLPSRRQSIRERMVYFETSTVRVRHIFFQLDAKSIPVLNVQKKTRNGGRNEAGLPASGHEGRFGTLYV